MNHILLERIASIRERLGRYELLPEETFRTAIGRCLQIKKLLDCRAAKERRVQDDDAQEVRRWLWELPIMAEVPVYILWPALRSGISTGFGEFVEVYDDLWLPGADDVWVQPPSTDWLLELDHEEVFRFFVGATTG